MTITQIQPQKRSTERCNIFIDGEFAFSLSTETVYEFRLKSGQIVDEEYIQRLRAAGDGKLCFSAALKAAARKRYTESGLRTYLEGKDFLPASIDAALAKLIEYGYIDDKLYTEDYIRINLKDKGIRRIKFELVKKGILQPDIPPTAEDEYAGCEALAVKFMKNRENTFKEKQRLYRYLASRGYGAGSIKRAMEIAIGGGDDGWED